MDLEQRVAELERLLANIVRVGIVSSVGDEAGTARVVFDDRDDMVSYDMQVVQRQSLQNKDYVMPDVSEQVVCLFLPSGVEQGFVLGSYYSTQESRPADTRDVRRVVFSDGTAIEYNRSTHVLTANVQGDVVVTTTGDITATAQGDVTVTAAGQITMTAPNITLNGSVLINGPLAQGTGSAGGGATMAGPVTVANDVTAGGISLQGHTHTGVQPGGGNTGTPV